MTPSVELGPRAVSPATAALPPCALPPTTSRASPHVLQSGFWLRLGWRQMWTLSLCKRPGPVGQGPMALPGRITSWSCGSTMLLRHTAQPITLPFGEITRQTQRAMPASLFWCALAQAWRLVRSFTTRVAASPPCMCRGAGINSGWLPPTGQRPVLPPALRTSTPVCRPSFPPCPWPAPSLSVVTSTSPLTPPLTAGPFAPPLPRPTVPPPLPQHACCRAMSTYSDITTPRAVHLRCTAAPPSPALIGCTPRLPSPRLSPPAAWPVRPMATTTLHMPAFSLRCRYSLGGLAVGAYRRRSLVTPHHSWLGRPGPSPTPPPFRTTS